MKRNQHDIRKTAVLAAAAAAGMTLLASSAGASETRPADFETEFELDQAAPENADTFIEAAFVAEIEAPDVEAAAFEAAAVDVPEADVPPVVDEWECCAAVELVAREATMEGWADAVSDYLDRYVDRSDPTESAEPDAAQAAASQVSTTPTVCEFCLAELALQKEEQQQAEDAADLAAAAAAMNIVPPQPVECQLLTEWTLARFAAISRTLEAIDPAPEYHCGDACFRLPVGDEIRASAD